MRPVRRLPSQQHLYLPSRSMVVANTARESAVTEYAFAILAWAEGSPCLPYSPAVTVRKTRRLATSTGK